MIWLKIQQQFLFRLSALTAASYLVCILCGCKRKGRRWRLFYVVPETAARMQHTFIAHSITELIHILLKNTYLTFFSAIFYVLIFADMFVVKFSLGHSYLPPKAEICQLNQMITFDSFHSNL